MSGLRDYFDRVVGISLDRRRGRWEQFLEAVGSCDWPFREPERFPAVDGDAVTVPMWWKQGGGAWGCLMSHARILEDCIRLGVERVLILEDDVVFVENVRERVERFLANVPADWDQLYFGGQHLRDPHRLNDEVFECVNINRTHCHAVSRRFMPRMYRYILNAHDYLAHPGHHIDHRLGALQETGTVKAYAPTEWMAGQRSGRSDISGRSNETYFWNTWAGVPDMTMFVVVGLHEGRANEVAGLMRSLGIHFGHTLRGYRPPRVEDAGLSAICERVFPFPSTERKLRVEESAPLLHDWCRLILQEAANCGTAGAACYPHLCAMYEDLSRAWRHLRVISVPCSIERGIDALAARSAEATGWLHIPRASAAELQTFLDSQRREWLACCESLTVDPDRISLDRASVAAEIREFVGLSLPASADPLATVTA